MAHSLETRVPFMDNDLVDFAMKCPVKMKLNDLEDKSFVSMKMSLEARPGNIFKKQKMENDFTQNDEEICPRRNNSGTKKVFHHPMQVGSKGIASNM